MKKYKKTFSAIAISTIGINVFLNFPTNTVLATDLNEQKITLSSDNLNLSDQTYNMLSLPHQEGDVTGSTDHTFISTTSRIISIEDQNRDAAAKALLIGAAAYKIGGLGYVTYQRILGSVGTLTTLGVLFTGKSGAQYPIRVTTTAFKAKKPTSTYYGYAVMTFRNTYTGATINSKKIIIGKTGI